MTLMLRPDGILNDGHVSCEVKMKRQRGADVRYLPVQLQAGLCRTEQREVGGVRVRRRLQGLNQSGGGAHGTGANNVDLPHSEPGDDRERTCERQFTTRIMSNIDTHATPLRWQKYAL